MNETLKSFIKYCQEHPSERFWQALRNWSGYSFILASDQPPSQLFQKDTFYLHGRNHEQDETKKQQSTV